MFQRVTPIDNSESEAFKVPKEEYQSYLVGISEWKTDYNFSIGIGNQSANAYSEYFELEIAGQLIAPEKFANKAIKLILLGNRVLDVEFDLLIVACLRRSLNSGSILTRWTLARFFASV